MAAHRVQHVWWLLVASFGCKDLPAHTPDAELNKCGNGLVEDGELCEPGAPACGQPGTPQACQITCDGAPDSCPAGFGCDDQRRCQYVVGFTSTWTGPLPHQELEVVDIDGDKKLDLVGADATGAHVRLGDGAGGFADQVDFTYRDVRSGPVVIADFENNGTAEIAVVVGANGTDIDVMRLSNGTLAVITTLSLASGERILGVLAARAPGRLQNDLVALVQTASGRVLRRYDLVASRVVDRADGRLDTLAEPVVWAAASPAPGDAFVGVSRVPVPPRLIWFGEYSDGTLNFYFPGVLTSVPIAVAGSRNGEIRNETGGAVTSMMAAYADGVSVMFTTPLTVAALGGQRIEPAVGAMAWLQHRGGRAGSLAVATPASSIVLAGVAFQPTPIPIPRTPQRIRTGDLDGDGLTDLVLGGSGRVDALLSKGHVDP